MRGRPLSSRSVSTSVHMLFVTWQAPESRRIFPIARVTRRASGEYEWVYVRAVTEARAHGFAGLPGYDDIDAVCVSRELPALFAHRVPARGRRRSASMAEPANDQFDPTPIILLVPLGPGTNERLEVFAPPLPAHFGKAWGVFFARGVGRIPGSESAVERLTPNDPLRLRPEPDNPHNPRALLILSAADSALGYVPDYLANELGEALDATPGADAVAHALRVEVLSVERVNHAPAAPIYNVLCRYTCSAELGARLFRSERYQPVAYGAESEQPRQTVPGRGHLSPTR
jgi:HIRAN domain